MNDLAMRLLSFAAALVVGGLAGFGLACLFASRNIRDLERQNSWLRSRASKE